MNLLSKDADLHLFKAKGGGKAYNMRRLSQSAVPVPNWLCVSADSYDSFIKHNNLQQELKLTKEADLKEFSAKIEKLFIKSELPESISSELRQALEKENLLEEYVAVRSSGLDEDSSDHSFAGQFSSYLYQKGFEQIELSLKKCWASAFSERALSYRVERSLSLNEIGVGVVIQKMVHSEKSGVSFSRHPIRVTDRNKVLLSSVWGIGEGLVSGELDADTYEYDRDKEEVSHRDVVEKEHEFIRNPESGLTKVNVANDKVKQSSLTENEIKKVAQITAELEKSFGEAQDCEWAIEDGKIYFVQARPITNLPPDSFFDESVRGKGAILWDNSNIIESYSGVTSPLTFSFASYAYEQVYIQFCQMMGVPKEIIQKNERVYRNMLGILRGRIYYNLVNWYKLVVLLPGASGNKEFMETMMGVQQKIKPEFRNILDLEPQDYSFFEKSKTAFKTLWRFIRMDSIIADFNKHFLRVYNEKRKIDYTKLSLTEIASDYEYISENILKRWKAPIINDYLCMLFFGLLKKLTKKWIKSDQDVSSLQNDLLCGQGDVESTMPTKTLMKIAEYVDKQDSLSKEIFLNNEVKDVLGKLKEASCTEVLAKIDTFLDLYGFRCINELKLEEPDLHDDPSFVITSVASYIRTKSYSIEEMEKREQAVRNKAIKVVEEQLSGPKRWIYFWVLKQARRAVKNRENLRFARTKIFGVSRHLFRGVGFNLEKLGLLSEAQDVFYLSVDEIFSFIEGRALSVDLNSVAQARKKEYQLYRDTLPPPDRMISYGAVGAALPHNEVLMDWDLMADEALLSDDPNVLIGTPCCPGVIEGEVRVAKSIDDVEGINGEILVTARTDPGWVPIYPSCSALLIERGSLLSHSAVVARELGLPTIVGVRGGLMKKLKTGQKVRIDAAKGEIRIL